jgi:hypothetical protein
MQTIVHNRIQIFAIMGSISLFLLIVRLIQRRRLKEEFALLWLLIFLSFVVISLFKPILELIAKVAGIYYPPAALLLLLILGITIILIHYSTVISKLSEQNKTLIQEVALIKTHLHMGQDPSQTEESK